MPIAGDKLSLILVLDLASDLPSTLDLFSSMTSCRAVQVRSREQFDQALGQQPWHLIIVHAADEASAVVEELLQADTRKACPAPVVLMMGAATGPDRLHWMQRGACDCVPVDQPELLRQVVLRELAQPARVLEADRQQPLVTRSSVEQLAAPDSKAHPAAAPADCPEKTEKIRAMVQDAWENKRFRLMFQAVTGLKASDNEEHYDVLLRLQDPEGKLVCAGQFISAVDLTPVAVQLDKWVIWNSLRRLQAHQQGAAGTRLFIHLSGASVQDGRFSAWLEMLIKKAAIDPSLLIFQLAEQNIVRFPQQTLALLKQLRALGCSSSLCHFDGSTQAMHIARDCPTDYIKLAGPLIRKLASDPGQETFVRHMITQLRAMGRRTIAPWIEDPSVMTRVWRTGTHYVQGHFVQKPAPDMNYDFHSGQ